MEQRNLILAIVLSVSILLGFELLVGGPMRDSIAPTPSETPAQTVQDSSAPAAHTAPAAPTLGVSGEAAPAVAATTREGAIAGPRDAIESTTLQRSLSLIGARIDDILLKDYHETVDPESAHIVLFSPIGAPKPYYAEFGWTAAQKLALPGPETHWQADRDLLIPGQPVTLTWDNGEGLLFKRVYALDENYMFTVTQTVENAGAQTVSLSPYGLVARTGTPKTTGYFILHEGMTGVLDGTLKEYDYDDLQDDGTISKASTGGWLGFTDKYWMASVIPASDEAVTARFVHSNAGGIDKYQADFLASAVELPAGGAITATSHLFAGAKKVKLLDGYEEQLGIEKFDLAVDFGWFYFLTKPMFLALHWLYGLVGNFGIAILILTIGVKLVFFPLANKSYQAMARMRRLQPEMQKLRERFGDDRQRMNQELMALYKKEGANPVAGCLPIVIQIPVFFALYKVIFVTIEMRHAPFFGWIRDLSAPDPTSIINLFGLLPYGVPDLGPLQVISIGILPLVMGFTMFLQQQLNPQPADPMQARIFLFMPIIFTFLLAHFPAGLVVYWTWNNTLSIMQQAVIMKKAGVPIGRGSKVSSSAPKAGTHAEKKGDKKGEKTKAKAKAKVGE
jgi:YidC/Oxa1 family membrane protein insertase